MFNKLQTIDRFRVKDNRDFSKYLYLNRAERVAPLDNKIIDRLSQSLDLNQLGFYYDLSNLYQKLSDFLDLDQNNFLITNGAEEAIRYIFNVHVKPDDIVMFPTPTYGMYYVFSKIYCNNFITLEYSDFKINKSKLYENIGKIKVFFLPNPSHIEDLFDEEEIINLLNILKKNNSLLVLDETYYGYGSDTMIKLIYNYNNLYIIRSFSKYFGLPAIRVGILISNKDNMSAISNYRPAYEISYLSSKVLEFFLTNNNFIKEYINECIIGREYLIKNLNKNYIKYNGNNNYLVNIEVKNNIELVVDELKKNNIIVKKSNNYLTLTIGPIKYMEHFWNYFINIYKC